MHIVEALTVTFEPDAPTERDCVEITFSADQAAEVCVRIEHGQAVFYSTVERIEIEELIDRLSKLLRTTAGDE